MDAATAPNRGALRRRLVAAGVQSLRKVGGPDRCRIPVEPTLRRGPPSNRAPLVWAVIERVKTLKRLGAIEDMSEERLLTIRAGERSLDCYLAFPESGDPAGPHPGVIVLHEIFGADEHIRDVARRISALGYVTIAPELFPKELRRLLTPPNIALALQSLAQAPPELRRDPARFASFVTTQPAERRPILEALGKASAPAALDGYARDVLEVARHLRTLPEVEPTRVAAVGFCFGGSVTGRLATIDPDLRAAVIFYGQNPPLENVARIRARVLGFYGSDDPGLTQTVPELAAAMGAAGKSFQHHVYPGARHAFFNDTRPNYHRMSAEDAWDRMVRFFGETLNG